MCASNDYLDKSWLNHVKPEYDAKRSEAINGHQISTGNHDKSSEPTEPTEPTEPREPKQSSYHKQHACHAIFIYLPHSDANHYKRIFSKKQRNSEITRKYLSAKVFLSISSLFYEQCLKIVVKINEAMSKVCRVHTSATVHCTVFTGIQVQINLCCTAQCSPVLSAAKQTAMAQTQVYNTVIS